MIFWPPWAAWLQSSHRYPAPDTRRTWLRSLSREVPIPGGWRPRETLNTATTSQRLRGEVRASARLVITSTDYRGKCVAKCVAKLREAESEQLHREAQRGREGVPCSLATSLTSSWVQIRLALCLPFWHTKKFFFILFIQYFQTNNQLIKISTISGRIAQCRTDLEVTAYCDHYNSATNEMFFNQRYRNFIDILDFYRSGQHLI